MHLALRSALQAPLLLPGSYFSALLAAPSSPGCFCGRGTLLETRLPFIALNVTRRSLGSAPPTCFDIGNGPAGGDEVIPHCLSTDGSHPACCPRSPAEPSQKPPSVLMLSASLRRTLGCSGAERAPGGSALPLCDPLLGSQLLLARPHAGTAIDGFYCQVVIKWIVPELFAGGHVKLL